MKKYTLILFAFAASFILLGLSAKSANAFIDGFGCSSAGPYNIQTGQLCVNPTNVVGCQPGFPFSPVTGQSCSTSNIPLGCFSNMGYSTITGQPCNNNISYLPPGCSSNQGFSITTGQSCNGSIYFPPPNFPPNCPLNYGYGGVNNQFCVVSNTQPPVISSVSGPQSLNVNQQATWAVSAYDPNGGNLSYSVLWGDEQFSPYSNVFPSQNFSTQSATFTHVYQRAGNYSPTFTVTSNNTINCFTIPCPSNGRIAQTSLSVNVFGGTTQFQTPNISFLSPTSGAIGTQVTVFGSGFSGATVNFAGYSVPVSNISDSQIAFIVPSNLSNCRQRIICTQIYLPVNPGFSYPVSVSNNSGVSNSINFVVTNF